MKLTGTQEMHLRNVRLADESFKNAKKSALAKAREAALLEVHSYQAALDREVRLAHEAGVPRRQIGVVGMQTTDGKTVREALNRTEGVVAITEAENDPYAARYALHDGMLRVTLTADELDAAKHRVNFDDTQATAPTTALFAIDTTPRGVLRLTAAFGDTIEGSFERNPVVFWAYDNEVEALKWYSEHASVEEVAA